MSFGAQAGNTGRIVPYHTECDANYSEVETWLPKRTQLKQGVSVDAKKGNVGRLRQYDTLQYGPQTMKNERLGQKYLSLSFLYKNVYNWFQKPTLSDTAWNASITFRYCSDLVQYVRSSRLLSHLPLHEYFIFLIVSRWNCQTLNGLCRLLFGSRC